jgi:glycerate kinase
MIPRTLLVATCAFGERLSAPRVASAIARGLEAGGWPADLCPLSPGEPRPETVRELLQELDFDARMRAARALIVGEGQLHEDTLAGSFAFEIATRARQAGVPAYAVTGRNSLDSFDARILDLQAILQARTAPALEKAGRRLAELI